MRQKHGGRGERPLLSAWEKALGLAPPRRIPPYVAEHREMLDRMRRADRFVIRHLLPAPRAVRALIALFKRALRREERDRRILEHGVRSKVEWYATYWPCDYLPILTSEARERAYHYLLLTLKINKRAIAHPPDLDRVRGPRRRSAAHLKLSKAPEALRAVGKWWLDSPDDRPWANPEEKKAIRLGVRISKLHDRAIRQRGPILAQMERMTRALEWETKRLEESRRGTKHRG